MSDSQERESLFASSRWKVSHRADPIAVALADRHYNRQHVGSPSSSRRVVTSASSRPKAMPSGRPHGRSRSTSSTPGPDRGSTRSSATKAPTLSSELILEAIAATRWTWTPPDLGIITFVDAGKVRRKRDPGRCYRRAGFDHVGYTKGGLLVFGMLPDAMPDAVMPLGAQMAMSV